MADVVYTLNGIGFRYGTLWAVRGISLAIESSELVAVVGANGSGKSTLLRLLAGLMGICEGEIRLGSDSIIRMSAAEKARSIAWMPQESSILYPVTVRDLILLGRTPFARGFDFETEADRAVIRRVASQVGLSGLLDRSVETLSGGQRQRALLGMRLAQEPRVLVLDEPTSHLDLAVQLQVMGLIRRLTRANGVAAVIACHDLNLAAGYADRIILLKEGRLLAVGNPENVLSPDRISEAFGCDTLVDRHPISGRPRVTWTTMEGRPK